MITLPASTSECLQLMMELVYSIDVILSSNLCVGCGKVIPVSELPIKYQAGVIS